MNDTDDTILQGVAGLLARLHGAPRTIEAITEREPGPQGYSGSQVRYYEVDSRDAAGVLCHDTVVSKHAGLLERRILRRLDGQGCAVPPLYLADAEGEGRAPVYMPYLEARPWLDLGHPESPLTLSSAEGLAGIHAANRGQRPDWLPRTDDDYLGRLWLRAWQERWTENLAQADFRAEFGPYTARLEEAMTRFMGVLAALTAEGDTLTLLNVDLIPDHVRVWQGRVCFIDWEQSSYGTLYLDLPNHFIVETALTYRDALARHGYEIPAVEFMERYHEVGRYMGLRYLGFALDEWAAGGERRRQRRWFLYYTLHLALHGR